MGDAGSRPPSPVTVALVSSVVAVLLPTVTGLAKDVVPAGMRTPALMWPLAGVLMAAAVWVEVRRARAAEDAATTERLDRAAALLAAAVRDQWRAEAAIRQLNRSSLIGLGWTATVRSSDATQLASALARGPALRGGGRASSGAPAGERSRRLRLHGKLANAVADYRQLPEGQLIVVGAAGSGKTVFTLQLTLGLIEDRSPADPVPVPLPIASWDPRVEHLDTWLVRRLVQEYPGLANRGLYGAGVADALLNTRRILPILDGLDELPGPLRPAAIDGICQAVGTDRPVVLTCRTEEFRAAVMEEGSTLERAVEIEIEPVALPEAMAFLVRPGADETRWLAVFDRLRYDPHGPLATALSTPLMVWLARTAYGSTRSEPGELLDPDRFPDQAAVETHLLDSYLPAAYVDAPSVPGQRPFRRYPVDRARRWLSFLACHLEAGGTRDLAWWELHRAATRRVSPVAVGLCVGAVTGTVAAVVAVATGHLAAGIVLSLLLATGSGIGLGSGLRCGLRYARWAGAKTSPRPAAAGGALALGLAVGTGVLFVSRIGFFFQRWEPGGLAAGLASGLCYALAPAAASGFALGVVIVLNAGRLPRQVSLRMTGRSRLLGDILVQGLVYGLVAGVAVFVGFGVFSQALIELRLLITDVPRRTVSYDYLLPASMAFGLVSSSTGLLATPTDVLRAINPCSVLRGDRMVGVLTMVGVALAAGHLGGGGWGSVEWRWCTLVGLVVGALSTAWFWFVLDRVWLAIRGRAPVRFMAFLDDAYRRGVLRQTGSTYQFRHAHLQHRLATTAQPVAPSSARRAGKMTGRPMA